VRALAPRQRRARTIGVQPSAVKRWRATSDAHIAGCVEVCTWRRPSSTRSPVDRSSSSCTRPPETRSAARSRASSRVSPSCN